MEFPDLGDHCAERTCNKLDFLPMKCDGCADFFCSEHFSYKGHGCSSGRTDYKAPICPACQQVVPNPPDSSPDQAVSRHLDQFCPNEREKAKIFKNGCAYRNCKRKELVPIKCHLCQLNFCLKHRHNLDHDCEGERVGRQRQALARIGQPSTSQIEQVQGTMSEDEALSRAIFLSMQEGPRPVPPIAGDKIHKERCSLS